MMNETHLPAEPAPDFKNVVGPGDAQQAYRDSTRRHAAGPSIYMVQLCHCCKKKKSILGGRRKPRLAGPVSRFNPNVFTCRDCVEEGK